ncbi:MAG: 50S ribosomal protein L25 [Ilumatobacteraceae bacterium]|jgi:large subunit ribosomal protein L25
MTTVLITKTGRTTGSPESRRLRKAENIPAVIYGHGMTPILFTVGRRDLRIALSGPAGANTILELQVDDKKYPAIVKELQRDPVKRTVSHIDFMQINLSEEITMSVPVHLTGTAKAVLAEGGLVDAAVDRIEVRASADNIPNEIIIDVTNMKMNDVIRMGDIKLPKGVTAVLDEDMVIVTVLTTKAEAEKTVVAPTDDDAGETAAGAPAAGDDKPAAS